MVFRQIPVIKLATFLQPGEVFHFASIPRYTEDLVPTHTHDFAEIFWVRSQACEHHINGVVQILEPGAVVFMRPHDHHAIKPHNADEYRIANLAFMPDTVPSLQQRFPELETYYDPEEPMPHTLRLNRQQQAHLEQAAQRLSHGARNAIYLECFLLNLFTSLLPDAAFDVPGEAPDWLRRMIDELLEDQTFAEGTRAIARLSRRSPEYVAREIKRWMGMTPIQLINKMRMRWAARQLQSTDDPIPHVALACGVENVSHFYKLFQHAHGLPPSAWRKQSRSLT